MSGLSIATRNPRKRARLTLAATAIGVTTVAAMVGVGPLPASAATAAGSAQSFTETDLVSDIPHLGQLTDPNVKNPWGIALGPSTPLWVANNDTSVATVYAGANGQQKVSKVPLTVKIPQGSTGQVFNSRAGADPQSFVVRTGGQTGPAAFLFDSLGGQVAGWTASNPPGASAQIKRTVPGAVYTGLAMATVNGHDRLFAADGGPNARVDVYDSAFGRIGSFTDLTLKKRGLAPYNVAALGGKLYVSFAPPPGSMATPLGAIDVFSTTGQLLKRLVVGGALDGPWGMVIAPAHWGSFGGDLLVGNEDGGQIHAYNPATGAFKGTIKNAAGHPFARDGLWGLSFGNGVFGTSNSLIFVAGIDEYEHGLIGILTPNGR
jgi:uncharacterized protein (TIGR03118 family)